MTEAARYSVAAFALLATLAGAISGLGGIGKADAISRDEACRRGDLASSSPRMCPGRKAGGCQARRSRHVGYRTASPDNAPPHSGPSAVRWRCPRMSAQAHGGHLPGRAGARGERAIPSQLLALLTVLCLIAAVIIIAATANRNLEREQPYPEIAKGDLPSIVRSGASYTVLEERGVQGSVLTRIKIEEVD